MIKSKKKLVLFTANKNECIKNFPNTITVGTIMTYNSKDEYDTRPSMSGVVIIMIATIRDNKDESLWTNHIQTMPSTCKKIHLRHTHTMVLQVLPIHLVTAHFMEIIMAVLSLVTI